MEAEFDDRFNTLVNYTTDNLTYTWLNQPYNMIAFNIAVVEAP